VCLQEHGGLCHLGRHLQAQTGSHALQCTYHRFCPPVPVSLQLRNPPFSDEQLCSDRTRWMTLCECQEKEKGMPPPFLFVQIPCNTTLFCTIIFVVDAISSSFDNFTSLVFCFFFSFKKKKKIITTLPHYRCRAVPPRASPVCEEGLLFLKRHR
jgi:hypothetical protein